MNEPLFWVFYTGNAVHLAIAASWARHLWIRREMPLREKIGPFALIICNLALVALSNAFRWVLL